MEATLLHELATVAASRDPDGMALTYGSRSVTYGIFAQSVADVSAALITLGLTRGGRVGVYLDKRVETVAAMFATAAAGGAFVPLNPVLKPQQVSYILRDCEAQFLVTSSDRLALLTDTLDECNDLRHVLVIDADAMCESAPRYATHRWEDLQGWGASPHRVIDVDMAAILYTSGSTGHPKGVVLSHRNLVAGAKSVASYLENNARDTLLAVLPLSFDAGFSQLTTAFHAGARVVLLNYLLPKDVLTTLVRERVTGLTAVPPLYLQLTQLSWPSGIDAHLRYFANTGGRMPLETLRALRIALPEEQAVSHVRPHGSVQIYVPASRGSGAPPRLDRQGDPQRGDPRAARGWHRMRRRRTWGARSPGRARGHGLLERRGEDR